MRAESLPRSSFVLGHVQRPCLTKVQRLRSSGSRETAGFKVTNTHSSRLCDEDIRQHGTDCPIRPCLAVCSSDAGAFPTLPCRDCVQYYLPKAVPSLILQTIGASSLWTTSTAHDSGMRRWGRHQRPRTKWESSQGLACWRACKT